MAAKKGGLGRGLDSLFGDSSLLQKPAPVEQPEPVKTEEKESGKKATAKSGKTSNSKAGSKQTSGGKTSAKASSKETKTSAAEKESVQNLSVESVVYIRLSDIKPNSAQPRKVFKQEALEDLAASIKEHGVIQPVLLRPAKKGYELVAGERRWRAARLAGLKEIPAIVRDLDEKTNALYALIENMQREDLNAIEEAEGIREIIEKYELTQEETAKIVGKSRPYVSNALRLLSLPQEVKELVESGALSQGHARAVAGLEGEALQIEAARKAAAEGWSVRRIETYTAAQPKKKQARRKSSGKDAQMRSVEESLGTKLGTKVLIDGSEKKGKIEIEYYSREELERLIELLLR